MARILVTGGPVYAYLDDVKIVTNKFKGKLMWKLVGELSTPGNSILYLTSILNKDLSYQYPPSSGGEVEFYYHDGFDDYRNKVLELAPKCDAVILGAAVSNLIPAKRFPGKFASHNYSIGEEINIPFVIAPRIINEVKNVMRKDAHLFGFKLLSHVNETELINAAYDVLLDSKSTTIFANDAADLTKIYAVTKDKSVHQLERQNIKDWIFTCLQDEYYTTVSERYHPYCASLTYDGLLDYANKFAKHLISRWKDKYNVGYKDYIFGTVAIKRKHGDVYAGFWTTARKKASLDMNLLYVLKVNHYTREVFVVDSQNRSATLNAPLLDSIFSQVKKAEAVVHFHHQMTGLETFDYAIPGTKRDSVRNITRSFNIKGHGCYLILDENGVVL